MQLGQGAQSCRPSRRQTLSPFQSSKTKLEPALPLGQTILVGKTYSSRVTVQVLNINEPSRVMLRENLLFEGRFPSDDQVPSVG
jgi:hypothetical protein